MTDEQKQFLSDVACKMRNGCDDWLDRAKAREMLDSLRGDPEAMSMFGAKPAVEEVK